MILLCELIPAGKIRLQQHIRRVGWCSQQVGEQQRHLEVLTRAQLQDLRAFSPTSTAAVGQLVMLTVGGWQVCECGDNPQDKETDKAEVIHYAQANAASQRKCHN